MLFCITTKLFVDFQSQNGIYRKIMIKILKSKEPVRMYTGITVLLILFNILLYSESKGMNPAKKVSTVLEQDFTSGKVIRINFMQDNIIRIRISPKGKTFNESGLNKYDFIRDISGEDIKVKLSGTKKGFSAETSVLKITGNNLTGGIKITDPSGEKILLEQLSADFVDSSSRVTFLSAKDENWIGFGDQSRERIYHRGYIADCHVRNVKSYIPVPFFMSTQGTGVLVNTSYRVVFDMCRSHPENYSWVDESGAVDYYVMVGRGFRDLIDLYTGLTGKPQLPPEWSFGLWYICRTQANDYEAVNDAVNFRREGIPCDVIGLEPGWMEQNYDFTTKKAWSKERFPIPSYAQNGPHNFIDAIKRMGFKFELWLCNDYDLSYEEDRRLKREVPAGPQNVPAAKSSDIVEADGHLVKLVQKDTDNVKNDKLTIKEEPWFEHLKKFVDQGTDFFKQDGSNQVVEHRGKVWGNGMTDAELHNLYPLFYSRQMFEGFKAYTNRRPVIFTPAGWTGFQAWSGTWTGDTGGRLATLGAMLNTSIVGHSWSTNDMEVTEKEGIHFGYLQPWSQINSWNYFRMPWVQGAELLEMHKFYAQLRARLIPYLYSWAYNATITGWPMLIPLTMEFPDDIKCRENLHQYLLGRDIMVGIYNTKLWLPEGRWKDYWTGEVVEGEQEKDVKWPSDRGGGLYVREGGIIPFGPLMQYRGEKPVDEITLYVFPGEELSAFDLYEDDGISFQNQRGEFSLTRITSKKTGSISDVEIGEAKGNYKGKVENRKWNLIMHSERRPLMISINGKEASANDISWDEKRKEVKIKGIIAPSFIKVDKGN
jgi:alpha-glucosidase (family GH31 glycosyl hydrolase)